MNVGCLSEPKSKLGLPRVTMGLNKSLNQSLQGGLEKIGYTSSNGSPGNCCKVRNKHIIGHVLGGQNGGCTLEFFYLKMLKKFYILVVENLLSNLRLLNCTI